MFLQLQFCIDVRYVYVYSLRFSWSLSVRCTKLSVCRNAVRVRVPVNFICDFHWITLLKLYLSNTSVFLYVYVFSKYKSSLKSFEMRKKKTAVTKTVCKIHKLSGGQMKEKIENPREKRQLIRPVRRLDSSFAIEYLHDPREAPGQVPRGYSVCFPYTIHPRSENTAATSCCFSFTALGCFPFSGDVVSAVPFSLPRHRFLFIASWIFCKEIFLQIPAKLIFFILWKLSTYLLPSIIYLFNLQLF